MYPNVAKAADWLKLNANQLKATTCLPKVVRMDDHELQQLNKDADDEDEFSTRVRDATTFWFMDKRDWRFFIDELADHTSINACVEDCVRELQSLLV